MNGVPPGVSFWLGQSGDIPIVGDWDNTGFRRIGVFRNGQWWLDMNGDGKWDSVHDLFFEFGQADDIPVVGDWDHTGVQRIGVFRNGQWWLDINGDHQWTGAPDLEFSFGQAGDIPVVGDWDHTGVQRIGVFRNGQWWLDINGDHQWTGPPDLEFNFGQAGDAPVFGFATLVITTSAPDLNTCINSSGRNLLICELAPSSVPYPVYPTLSIGRSNTIITGGGGPGETILVRANSSPTNNDMMGVLNGVTNVTVSNLTFDGNRYGFGINEQGLSCLGGNAGIYDLNLTYAGPTTGTFTVEWVDFINAPGTALLLDGPGSSVSVSNFGQGGAGIGADGTQYPTSLGQLEPADQSATRSTAVYINGSSNGAWYNHISYAGTAGTTLNGAGQFAYGNWLFQNRYELSDGYGGGVLTLNGPGETDPHQSSYALVAGNVINGNYWPPQASPPARVNGCPFPGVNQSPGVEVYGTGHRLYNNEVYQNTGSGMTFAGSCDYDTDPKSPTYGQHNGKPACPVSDITISGVNYVPNSNDSPKYVEGNQFGGIWFRSGCPTCDASNGVTLDNLLVWNNAKWGINLSGVSIDPSNANPINGGAYSGFISQTCMSNTTYPNVTSTYANGLGSGGVPLNPNPYSSYTNPYTNPPWTGGSCPGRPGGTATPAPSNIPRWPW